MKFAKSPSLTVLPKIEFRFSGEINRRLEACIEQGILPMPSANPAILTMFRDQDRLPLHNWVPWAGEFAGKFLTHAVQVYRLKRDQRLYELMAWFVSELISMQAEDGYLGPWPEGNHLTGSAPNSHASIEGEIDGKTTHFNWDSWGHYHLMLGFMLWHEESGDADALQAAEKIADLFCAEFLDGGRRLVENGSEEMNLAPIHALCLLYEKTDRQRYFALAHEIEKDFETPPAGDYIRAALAGTEFFQMPKPRWESLHPIQSLAELYFITGQGRYRRAFEHIWWSIAKLDRHNNGGFSSGEQAQGSPYHPGAIETCCTVAWMALSVDMLRLTGDSVVADELELSLLNSGLGMMSPTGRWVSYNTPMDGTRIASPNDETSFQARPGQPELNCCSVNGPRALGLLSDWALMASDKGLVLNYYGPVRMTVNWNGAAVELVQDTDYPLDGRIVLTVNPAKQIEFTLKLRIPHWSKQTHVKVNDEAVSEVSAGRYLALSRQWRMGDVVTIDLDMSLHFWAGERECEVLTSVYRGPILMAYDATFDKWSTEDLPALEASTLNCKPIEGDDVWPQPWMLWEATTADGQKVRLCDFASAGFSGNSYRSWLPIIGVTKTEFSRQHPWRSAQIISVS